MAPLAILARGQDSPWSATQSLAKIASKKSGALLAMNGGGSGKGGGGAFWSDLAIMATT